MGESKFQRKCRMCKGCFSYSQFRPASTERRTKDRDAFDNALREIEAEGATRRPGRDMRFEALDAYASHSCAACREKLRVHNATNPKIGACREYWAELSAEPCVLCGESPTERDHLPELGPKVHALSDYGWWATSGNGGVDAMRDEARKCRAVCRNCHSEASTHNAYARRYPTVAEMPESTRKEKEAKRDRLVRDEKYEYVNARKMEIGRCRDCPILVKDRAFQVFVCTPLGFHEDSQHIEHVQQRPEALEHEG